MKIEKISKKILIEQEVKHEIIHLENDLILVRRDVERSRIDETGKRKRERTNEVSEFFVEGQENLDNYLNGKEYFRKEHVFAPSESLKDELKQGKWLTSRVKKFPNSLFDEFYPTQNADKKMSARFANGEINYSDLCEFSSDRSCFNLIRLIDGRPIPHAIKFYFYTNFGSSNFNDENIDSDILNDVLKSRKDGFVPEKESFVWTPVDEDFQRLFDEVTRMQPDLDKIKFSDIKNAIINLDIFELKDTGSLKDEKTTNSSQKNRM